jgi:type I restriction enzyme S subunit
MFNVPKLRFGEFEGEWVEKRLNKVSQVNPKSKKLPNEFIYIDLESVDKGRLVKSNKILKNNAPSRAKRVLLPEDILFQTVRPYQQNNYFYKLDGSYVASTGYAQIRANESTRFLYHKLHTDKFVNNVLLRCTGTSYPAINSTDLSKIKIFLPKEKEQQKIATFLTSIDQKIEQLNQKRTLLESYKKGLIQKIFSQKIRFKRDDGGEFEDWTLLKIENFLNERSVYPTSKVPLYSLTIENGIIPKSARYERSFLVKKDDAYKLMKRNDFAFNPMNLRFGALARHKEDIDVMVSKYYNIFYCNEKLIPKFAEEYFTTYNSIQFYNKMATGTLEEKKRVHYKDFLKFKFLFPSLKEQQKIATFLTSIDQKISQNNQALEQMKAFKKGLLQQMFV